MKIVDKIYNLYEESYHNFKEYEMTYEEINQLRDIIYEMSCSIFPLNDFFNDIQRCKNENYDKNQAYKDLCLLLYTFLDYEKKAKALEIITTKYVDLQCLFCSGYKEYNFHRDKKFHVSKEEFDLLKEVLKNE